jgi:hypothetical protein
LSAATTSGLASDAAPMLAPGRSCPLHYRYAPSVFARPAEARCEVLYVVGGLYGNGPALDAVLHLFDGERGVKRLVFNGDFHWFDIEPALFSRIHDRVLAFDALRGNVETELASPAGDADAGCGCAYPDWVDDAVVERSNGILQALRATARTAGIDLATLAALPMHRRVDVGPLRVAVVHGDATSLAGWGFAQELLRQAAQRAVAREWFDQAQVDAFACSHTCLPLFAELSAGGRTRAPLVLNNGAAGMPNFRADSAGLLTRVALHPFRGPARRFGFVRDGIYVDALAIESPSGTWQRQFDVLWPPGSDGQASYGLRIAQGPDYGPEQAIASWRDECG